MALNLQPSHGVCMSIIIDRRSCPIDSSRYSHDPSSPILPWTFPIHIFAWQRQLGSNRPLRHFPHARTLTSHNLLNNVRYHHEPRRPHRACRRRRPRSRALPAREHDHEQSGRPLHRRPPCSCRGIGGRSRRRRSPQAEHEGRLREHHGLQRMGSRDHQRQSCAGDTHPPSRPPTLFPTPAEVGASHRVLQVATNTRPAPVLSRSLRRLRRIVGAPDLSPYLCPVSCPPCVLSPVLSACPLLSPVLLSSSPPPVLSCPLPSPVS